MSTTHESEGFVSTPLEGQGARRRDNYYFESEENEVCFREADNEYKRLKEDFARIARNRRTRNHSRSDLSKSPSPRRRQPPRRSTNLPKFKIATFYATDVELWFNQIETQFDLHQITDDDEWYSLTCAALSGEVASDVRDVLLQPFRSHKYKSLKSILIERRGLTTPEWVNKVISGEKMGSDIPSRFLRRLQKTAGFGTQAVVGKAVIRQAFIRQMPTSIRTRKRRGTQDVDVLMIIMCLGPHSFQTLRPQSLFLTNKVILKLTSKIFVPYAPPQNAQQNNAAKRIDTAKAPVCYFHQT